MFLSQVRVGSGGTEAVAREHRETEAQFGNETTIGKGDGESQREIDEDHGETCPAARGWQSETFGGQQETFARTAIRY